MADPRTTRTTSLTATVLFLITDAARCACVQQRTTQRCITLTIGLLLAVGRQTVTGVLVTIGAGDRDWSSAYRLFRTPSVALDALRRTLLAQVLATVGRTGPLVVVLDGTQLPRTGRRMPGGLGEGPGESVLEAGDPASPTLGRAEHAPAPFPAGGDPRGPALG
ncbi:MAG: transposase [Thermomicrobiales bacterium]